MSWDVMVIDVGGNPPPIEQMLDEHRRSMGAAADVRAKISPYLPDLDWSDPSWGCYHGDGFSFEFNIGDEAEKYGFMVHVRGSGHAVDSLLQFAIPNGWSLLDCSSMGWINPENPSSDGWTGFQSYRDRVLNQLDDAGT